jgi:hypothetical protein
MRFARATRCLVPAVLLVCAVAAPVRGQAQPGGGALAERARAALAPLSALVGQWEGDAQGAAGPGAMRRFRQSEDVVFGAGKTVLIVRGTGRSTEASNAGEIVYEAAASIWFDPDSSRLRMRAHRAEGLAINADIELKPDTLMWGFPVPGGRVRYTLAYSETDWHEVGHFLRDGAAPMQFIEMRLKRLK